jgi:hypothetical protein
VADLWPAESSSKCHFFQRSNESLSLVCVHPFDQADGAFNHPVCLRWRARLFIEFRHLSFAGLNINFTRLLRDCRLSLWAELGYVYGIAVRIAVVFFGFALGCFRPLASVRFST